jgi:phosphoribosyl 1,2-cyclic phosphodiesterase
MFLRVLGSSSAGNCSVVWNDGRGLLVDCGFSLRYISRHLQEVGLTLRSIGGVLITHTHGDHVQPETLRRLLDFRIPVFCPSTVAGDLAKRYASARKARDSGLLREINGHAAAVDGFDVETFAVPHDSSGGCFGYLVHHETLIGRGTVALATDLGYPPEGLARRFAGAHAVVIESNHDLQMLEASRRPDWLKQRIREIGHLSNDQSAHFVSELLGHAGIPPQTIVLAHLSRECNTPALALASMQKTLHAAGLPDTRLYASPRSEPCAVIAVEPELP